MACSAGVPCVATDVGDGAKLVGNRDLVVPPRDPAALAAAWSRVLSMTPQARRATGFAGRARIVREYSLRAPAPL